MLRRSLLLSGIACLACTALGLANDYTRPTTARLQADVTYLADDEREGRGPGTRGLDAAADYIAAVFREAGLKPAPGAEGYFQKFEIRGEPAIRGTPSLTLSVEGQGSVELSYGPEFAPMSGSGSGKVEAAPVVFAGYGITAKDEGRKLDYDDYEGIDVKDKIVLIIRREPQGDRDDSPFDGKRTTPFAGLQSKIQTAAKAGAKAILMVNDSPGLEGKPDSVEPFQPIPAIGSIPLILITRAHADKLLAGAGAPTLAELEKQIDADLNPRSMPLKGVTASVDLTIERKPIKVKNVIGVLEGEGPLADETIVVGAHYDHLGYGGAGSLAFGARDIHNGADDNASGTATVMELARRLAHRHEPLPRRIVFMAYSAEERGLLGSEHYVANPLYPLEKTIGMINFDMVGRLDPEKRGLTVYGASSAENWDNLVSALARSQGIAPTIVPGAQDVFGASDHYSFYKKNIPVLFFFTGLHSEYHRPTDDTHLINFDGMTRIANLGELVLLDLAQRSERPVFQKLSTAAAPRVASASRGSGVYLGSRPAYNDTEEGKGVLLEGVTEGSPAEKGGLRGGDRIVKFAGREVKDIEGYMTAMSAQKPGDKVDIEVVRDGKVMTLQIILGARPSRADRD